MTAPRLGQGMPTNDGWVARMFADMQRQINELRSARSINKATVDPSAPVVQEISKNAVPLGSPPGAVTDQTASSVSMKVWQAGTDGDILFAVGVAGDAFPRLIFYADPLNGIWMGDGTFDPTGGANIFVDTDGTVVISSNNGGFRLGSKDARFDNAATAGNISVGPLAISGSSTSTNLTCFGGDPNGSLGGNLNDSCFRTDLSGGAWLYRCTTAGDAASAVWTVAI